MNLSESNELPPEIQDELDRMNADPNYGTRRTRPQRKVDTPCPTVRHTLTRPTLDEPCTFVEGHVSPHSFDLPVDEAELETPDSDEESLPNRHWLLITGIGIVAIGLILRWWLKRR